MAGRSAPPRAWQRMLSGRRLNLLDPSPLDVEAGDLARGLSRVARWNGQTAGDWAFSVAQHSLLVEHLVELIKPDCTPRLCLAALLHDAPEYVVGDLISPFKAAVGSDYKAFENRLLAAIHRRFGLPPMLTRGEVTLIKRADRAAAHFEAVQLAGFTAAEAVKFFGTPQLSMPEAILLTPVPPGEAEAAFAARLAELEARLTAR